MSAVCDVSRSPLDQAEFRGQPRAPEPAPLASRGQLNGIAYLAWRPRGRIRRLVVLCHGIGASGAQMAPLALAWSRSLPDTLFLAPTAPFPHVGRRARFVPFGLGARGREWYSIIDTAPESQESGVRQAGITLDGFIDAALVHFGICRHDYAIAGFSQGGMTALFAGLRRPIPPRVILTFAGSLIAPARLAGEIRNRPPVLLVHGEADGVVSPIASRQAMAQLEQLGVPVRPLFRAGLGHRIDETGILAGAETLGRYLIGEA